MHVYTAGKGMHIAKIAIAYSCFLTCPFTMPLCSYGSCDVKIKSQPQGIV